jgi:hypothetical protein
VLTSAADLVYPELGYPEKESLFKKRLFVVLEDDEQKVRLPQKPAKN